MAKIKMNTIELTEKLISFESTAEKYSECLNGLEFVEKYIRNNCSQIHINKYVHNGVYSILFSTQESLKFKKLMVGHLDVVPGNSKQFIPYIENGFLYGRGASDMKGPVAAMINAIIQYRIAFEDLMNRENIGLYLSTDEEQGGFDCSGYFVTIPELEYETIFVPDSLPNDTLTVSQKGFVILNLIANGKPAHGSEPWNGENAIDILIGAASKIKARYKNMDLEMPSLNLSKISGGTAINQVPDFAELTFDFRYFNPADKIKFVSAIEKLCEKNVSLSYKIQFEGNAVNLNSENKEFKKFIKILENENIDYKIGKETGSSDARFFNSSANCIMFMPQCGGAHEDIECIEIKSLIKFEEIVLKYISAV
jgi:succinyl-diaminopimelate desuccinylase